MLLPVVGLIGILAQAGPGIPEGGRGIRLLPVQEAAPQEGPAAPQEQEGAEDLSFIDLDRIEMDLAAGLAVYSSDFEAKPAFLAGISFRAPLPWLSGGVFELPEDDFGLFVGVRFTSVGRDFDYQVEEDSGVVILADIGLDYVLHWDEDFRFLAQAGLQYGFFGGVTGLDDGIAGLVGLSGEVTVDEGFRITLNPQLSFGDSGDMIVIIQAGILIAF